MSIEALLYIGLLILSLGFLVKASDWFVDSAESIGLSFGISPFIIGVTIVAFGTSLPELASSMAGLFNGAPEIVIANVVGSNIANIALVLGLVTLVTKEIKLADGLLNIDLPLLLMSAIFLWFVVQDQQVTYLEATLLLLGLVIFLAYSFKGGETLDIDMPKASYKSYLLLIISIILIKFSADYTLVSILKLSDIFGITSEAITLSFVALGTSLPEVIVSLSAARKGKTDMAFGNVLGSNIFNTYAVMSIPAFFGTLVIPESILAFSLPLMVAMTLIFIVLCLSKRISRWEGMMLLLFYVYFIAQLFE